MIFNITSIPPERQVFVHKGLTADRCLFTPTVALTTTEVPSVFHSKLTRTEISSLLWHGRREELHLLVFPKQRNFVRILHETLVLWIRASVLQDIHIRACFAVVSE